MTQLSEQERHSVEHARYQADRATPDNPDCCFDYELVKTLVGIVDRLRQPQRSKQVDPAELWERYLDEIRADRGTPSPQGAMAFAVDALTRPCAGDLS